MPEGNFPRPVESQLLLHFCTGRGKRFVVSEIALVRGFPSLCRVFWSIFPSRFVDWLGYLVKKKTPGGG